MADTKDEIIDNIVSELMKKPMNKAEIMNMFDFSLRSCDKYIAQIQEEKEIPIKKQNIKGVIYLSIDAIQTLNNNYYMNIYLSPSNIVVGGRIYKDISECLADKLEYDTYYKYIKTITIDL